MIDKSTVKGTRSTHQPGLERNRQAGRLRLGLSHTHTHTDHVVKAG